VASAHYLRYYCNEYKTGDADIRAKIDLNLVDISSASGRYFTLYTGDGKVTFKAKSGVSAREWCMRLRELQTSGQHIGRGLAIGRRPATRRAKVE